MVGLVIGRRGRVADFHSLCLPIGASASSRMFCGPCISLDIRQTFAIHQELATHSIDASRFIGKYLKMPRKSAKSAKSTPETALRSSSKRRAADTPHRVSKRARTARKSYVETDTDSDTGAHTRDSSGDAESGDASAFEAQSEKEATSESEPDDEVSDDEPTLKKSAQKSRLQKKHVDEKELWKPGTKLEPGTQLIIKKPKARDAGDTPYTESTVHPNTMLFLKEIKANNDRQWLKCASDQQPLSLGLLS